MTINWLIINDGPEEARSGYTCSLECLREVEADMGPGEEIEIYEVSTIKADFPNGGEARCMQYNEIIFESDW